MYSTASMNGGFRILDLLTEAEPEALQPLVEAATVIQKHWRGIKVSHAHS